jgi:tetratricopeptide (TPR) repeat protein
MNGRVPRAWDVGRKARHRGDAVDVVELLWVVLSSEFWTSRWGEIIKQLALGLTGLVTIGGLVRKPLRKAWQRWRVQPMPVTTINILIADLAGDNKDRAQLVHRSLSNQLGADAHGSIIRIQRCHRTLAESGGDGAAATERLETEARQILHRIKAHFMVSGEVADTGNAVSLRVISVEELAFDERAARSYVIDPSTRALGPELCRAIGESLTLLVASQSIEQVKPLLEKVEALLSTLPTTLDPLTQAVFKTVYAVGQAGLGIAEGDVARISRAIDAYREALQIWPEAVEPLDRAVTQMFLGQALLARGRIVQNTAMIEEGISELLSCANKLRSSGQPIIEGMVVRDRGVALRDLGLMQRRADRLAEAMKLLRQSQLSTTRESYPLPWAHSQHEIGVTHRLQFELAEEMPISTGMRGKLSMAVRRVVSALPGIYRAPESRLDDAITALRLALEERAEATQPNEWAESTIELARALSAKGDRFGLTDALDEAIVYFTAALRVRSKEADAVGWAFLKNDEGGARFSKAALSGNNEDILECQRAYRDAVSVLTREAFPTDWSTMQSNIGLIDVLEVKLAADEKQSRDRAIAAIARMNRTLKLWPEGIGQSQRSEVEGLIAQLEEILGDHDARVA